VIPPAVVELLPVFNELDILQARVTLMDGVVDRHLVVEGNVTHQGDPKPLHLDGADLPTRVKRYEAVMRPGSSDTLNWRRERFQRDALMNFTGDLEPDALVLSCDVDEIVDPAAIDRIAEACEHGPVSLDMRMLYYGTREDPNGWAAAKAFRAKHMPDSLSDLRLSRCPIVRDCGWHLSYLGDEARRRTKIEAYAHAENRHPDAWTRIAAGRYGPNGEQLVDADLTTLPTVLRDLIA
jgi:hypothetical protein